MKTMQMHSKSTEAAVVWSTLVNHPLCYYDEHYDLHMVAWNGIITTRSFAMTIVATTWMSMYPANSQKNAMMEEIRRAVACGALPYGGRAIEFESYYDVMSYFKYKLSSGEKSFMADLRDKYTAKEAFGWFRPENERTFTKEHNEA